MAENKNQHYLPQFAQRFFTDDPVNAKTVRVFHLATGNVFGPAPIDRQSSGDYFYGRDQKLEDMFKEHEGNTAAVYRRLIAEPAYVPDRQKVEDEFGILALHAGLQLQRTPVAADRVFDLSHGAFTKLIDRFHDVGMFKDIDAETHTVQPGSPITMAVSGGVDTFAHFITLDLALFDNTSDVEFVLPDTGVARFNHWRRHDPIAHLSLSARGIMVLLPLSPRLLALFYDPSTYSVGRRRKRRVSLPKSDVVAELNRVLVTDARQVVYFTGHAGTRQLLAELRQTRGRPSHDAAPVESFAFPLGRESVKMETPSQGLVELRMPFLDYTIEAVARVVSEGERFENPEADELTRTWDSMTKEMVQKPAPTKRS
jgi:hypothetical protein